ncbi:MAG: ATP-binding cassette domain-containing protein [Steroidobacterales bacterium]
MSWRLRPGERWALIGANGAGKTQLLKLLAADVWPTPTGREELIYRLGSRPVARSDAKPRIDYLGAEAQDKYSRYGWNPTVGELLATGLHQTDLLLSPVLPREQRRIAAMLRACAMTRLGKRRFLSLSYGQKRLVLLARALVRRPDWLLLDELYNGLGQAFRERIDRLLAAARRRGQSWVIAAHRAMDVPRGTTRLIELEDGRVQRMAPLRHAALASLAATAAASPHPPAQSPGKPLLRLVDADLYVDYRPVLRDINWQLRSGEHWAVTGPNGAGKSSFLKLLYGDLSPALGGRVERSGYPAGTPIEAWKRRVGFVSPELQTDYLVDVSVADLVASGRHASIGLAAAPSAADRRIARRWLRFFGLSAQRDLRPRELSYGQMRRALLARALAANPRILLLDEPVTGLDPRQRELIRRLLERLMARGLTVVIAGHHPEDLPRGINRILHLSNTTAIQVEPRKRSSS